ncbi:MAG: beta-glucosidase, partial [Bacteroidales bacterium]
MKHLLLLILSTLLLTMVFLACNQQSQKEAGANSLAMDDSLNPDDLHRRTFDYFWETVDSVSGLT